jgi:ribosomal protein L11 methyltransferase
MNESFLYLLQADFGTAVSAEEREIFCCDHIPWGWEESFEDGQVSVQVYCNSLEGAQHLSQKIANHFHQGVSCTCCEIANQDWEVIWRDFFKPLVIEDTFLILPSWEKQDNCHASLRPVTIHPQMAFGTGDHPTTFLCLRALAYLWKAEVFGEEPLFLDLGTGSGILGIAATSVGFSGVGIDIDPVALGNARVNCLLNEVQDSFCLCAGEVDIIQGTSRFDLIFANIYAKPLLHIASSLKRLVTLNGYIILSGILQSQFLSIVKCYENHGLNTCFILQHNGWVALVLSGEPQD